MTENIYASYLRTEVVVVSIEEDRQMRAPLTFITSENFLFKKLNNFNPEQYINNKNV
jgi:hypothetical protein